MQQQLGVAPLQGEHCTRYLVAAIVAMSTLISIVVIVFNMNSTPSDFKIITTARVNNGRGPGTQTNRVKPISPTESVRAPETPVDKPPIKHSSRPTASPVQKTTSPTEVTTAKPKSTPVPTSNPTSTPVATSSPKGTPIVTANPKSTPIGDKDPDQRPLRLEHLTLWSSDFSVDAIRDVLQIARISVVDKSLSGECHRFNTCQHDLQVINSNNAVTLGRGNSKFGACAATETKRQFFKHYRENMAADAFFCNQPAAMCELFMPFNKPLIVYAVTRYDMGRWDENALKMWNKNLRLISKDDKNVVATNNFYDAKYIQHFTGIKPRVIPFYCNETKGLRYNPTSDEILVGPGELPKELYEKLHLRAAENGIALKRFEELKDWRHNLQVFTTFKAVIWIPTDVTSLLMTQLYRMNIPLFAPSIPLLTKWVTNNEMMEDRTWRSILGSSFQQSLVSAHPSSKTTFDPNENSSEAVGYWIKYADFYKWKHIQTFSSFKDVTQQLLKDLSTISNSMLAENQVIRSDIINSWQQVFAKVSQHQRANLNQASSFTTYDEAMKQLYKGRAPLEAHC